MGGRSDSGAQARALECESLGVEAVLVLRAMLVPGGRLGSASARAQELFASC